MHWTTRANLSAILVVCLIGAVDAIVTDQWDLLAVFAILLVLALPLVTGLDRSRRLVLLRRDLAEWLDRRSATTGEPVGAIADRAVARHRDRIEQGDEDAPAGEDA